MLIYEKIDKLSHNELIWLDKIIGYSAGQKGLSSNLRQQIKYYIEMKMRTIYCQLLFNIEIHNRKYLNKEKINRRIRKIFEIKGNGLSSRSMITKIDENCWEIIGRKERYKIENIGKCLNVYNISNYIQFAKHEIYCWGEFIEEKNTCKTCYFKRDCINELKERRKNRMHNKNIKRLIGDFHSREKLYNHIRDMFQSKYLDIILKFYIEEIIIDEKENDWHQISNLWSRACEYQYSDLWGRGNKIPKSTFYTRLYPFLVARKFVITKELIDDKVTIRFNKMVLNPFIYHQILYLKDIEKV